MIAPPSSLCSVGFSEIHFIFIFPSNQSKLSYNLLCSFDADNPVLPEDSSCGRLFLSVCKHINNIIIKYESAVTIVLTGLSINAK